MKQGPARAQEAFDKLRHVALLLADEKEPSNLVPLILDQAIALVGAERGFVILVEGGPSPQLRIAAARNLDREAVQTPEFKVSHSIAQRVATTGEAELLSDAAGDARTRDLASVRGMNLRSVLCVPLRAHAQTLGVVYVDHRFVRGEFDAEDKALLELFAVPAAIALDAARRHEELRRGHDELVRRLQIIERLRAEVVERYRERSREANRLKDASLQTRLGDLRDRAPRDRRALERHAARHRARPQGRALGRAGRSSSASRARARSSSRARSTSSRRARRSPFVAVNCAALAEPLLESELFGHERGAFTGAVQRARRASSRRATAARSSSTRSARCRSPLQAKLLRVLQEQRGPRASAAHEPIPVDVRVVAATNRDLDAMVAAGTFREDLYYRLNVVAHRGAAAPRARRRHARARRPLRSRATGSRCGARPEGARELLLAHAWPGNVRELENEISRLSVLAQGGVARPANLSAAILRPAFGAAPLRPQKRPPPRRAPGRRSRASGASRSSRRRWSRAPSAPRAATDDRRAAPRDPQVLAVSPAGEARPLIW